MDCVMPAHVPRLQAQARPVACHMPGLSRLARAVPCLRHPVPACYRTGLLSTARLASYTQQQPQLGDEVRAWDFLLNIIS